MLSFTDLENLRQEFNLPREKTIQNHYQPIQATYYDKTGRLISFHINCYAGLGVKGKNDLNWNQQNAFASFVPNSIAPLDTILPLTKHLQFIKTFDNKPIDTTGFSAVDYTIIIHWGKNLRPKDCRNLFKIVKENSLLAKGKNVNILYANNDNLW